MADIKRKLSELLVDYADNNSGDITPNKLRNGFKSVFGSTDVYTVSSSPSYSANSDNVVILYSYPSIGSMYLPAVSADDGSGSSFKRKEYIVSNLSTNNLSVIDLKNNSSILTVDPGDFAYIAANDENWNVVFKLVSSNFVKTSGSTMTGQLKTPSVSANYFRVNTATAFTSSFVPSAGTFSWNPDDKTINVGLENGSVLQLGQEEILYATNLTSATINNGQVVNITGSQGNRIVVALAQATTSAQGNPFFAIATQSISPNQAGYFTRFGIVRDVNTGLWNEGDLLWLSTSAGVLTNVQPGKAYTQVPFAVVTRGHGVVGTIMVAPTTIPRIQNLAGVDANNPINGNSLIYVSETNTWQTYGNAYAWEDATQKFYNKEIKWDTTSTIVSANSAAWNAKVGSYTSAQSSYLVSAVSVVSAMPLPANRIPNVLYFLLS